MTEVGTLDGVSSARDAPPSATALHAVYALYALGFLLPIFWIVGLIVAYVERTQVRDTWLESHCTWSIHTFWFAIVLCLLWILPAVLLTVVFAISIIGIPLIVAVWLFPLVWFIYRIVVGWLALLERRPAASLFA